MVCLADCYSPPSVFATGGSWRFQKMGLTLNPGRSQRQRSSAKESLSCTDYSQNASKVTRTPPRIPDACTAKAYRQSGFAEPVPAHGIANTTTCTASEILRHGIRAPTPEPIGLDRRRSRAASQTDRTALRSNGLPKRYPLQGLVSQPLRAAPESSAGNLNPTHLDPQELSE